MPQGSRPARVADQVRQEITTLLAREVHDPGIGFITITRVEVTADLQIARVFYTVMGDASARQNTARALDRAHPFLRRMVGQRLRLRHVPDLEFFFDKSIGYQDRIEQIIHEIHEHDAEAAGEAPAPPADDHDPGE